MDSDFKFQPTLQGQTIALRPLRESDFDAYYACASDKNIWQGHPHTDRYKLSEFKPYFQAAIDSKAFVVVTDNQSGKIIGASKYYTVESVPQDISIGFTFLACEYWGGKTNFELKTLMLNYAFEYFDVVWFHIAPSNIRSQKATQKIGAKFTHEEILNISGKPESWLCYQLSKQDWEKVLEKTS